MMIQELVARTSLAVGGIYKATIAVRTHTILGALHMVAMVLDGGIGMELSRHMHAMMFMPAKLAVLVVEEGGRKQRQQQHQL